MKIKISVIIPVYNMARYLPECLDSIVRQTLNDIEILGEAHLGVTDYFIKSSYKTAQNKEIKRQTGCMKNIANPNTKPK